MIELTHSDLSHRFEPTRRALVRALALAAAGAAGLMTAPALSAQTLAWPTQPVKIIVPFGPGGGVDIVARTIGDEWTRQTGHKVIVENRAGAGGNIGSASVAKSAPDGYTLLLASNSNSYNDFLYSSAGYNPANDLSPVLQIGRVPTVLVVAAGSPFKSVQDVIAAGKADPGKLNFAHFGFGSSGHLLYELFIRRAGISANHVPYKGNELYTDMLAGRTDLVFNNQLGVMSYIRAGQMRVLGVASGQRSALLPDVPTISEQGLAGFQADVWWGVMTRAGTPEPVLQRINQLVNEVLRSPEVIKRLEAQGASVVGGSAAQFARFFSAERATWQKVIADAKIKID
jgi:tripartite-type tricarboxylate transporter receptor subunit TctC